MTETEKVFHRVRMSPKGMIPCFHAVLDPSYCMDVRYSGTADGMQVQAWHCNGSGAPTWALK